MWLPLSYVKWPGLERLSITLGRSGVRTRMREPGQRAAAGVPDGPSARLDTGLVTHLWQTARMKSSGPEASLTLLQTPNRNSSSAAAPIRMPALRREVRARAAEERAGGEQAAAFVPQDVAGLQASPALLDQGATQEAARQGG